MAMRRGRKTAFQAAKLALKKSAFLKAYKKLGGKALAAAAIKVDRNSVWLWEQKDEEFRIALADVEAEDTEDLEKEMRRRAKKKSDLLMMFALKKRKPEYRDSSKLELGGSLTVNIVNFADKKQEPKP